MSHLSDKFTHIEQFRGDVFVADYTNATKSARKLEFFSEAPNDIHCFHLKNQKASPVLVYAINFEKNPSIFEGHKNCECILTSEANNKKPWVLLLEMKYCYETNVEGNSEDAYFQLKKSFELLTQMRIINTNTMNIYLNLKSATYRV